jgi:hypothetical protein
MWLEDHTTTGVFDHDAALNGNAFVQGKAVQSPAQKKDYADPAWNFVEKCPKQGAKRFIGVGTGMRLPAPPTKPDWRISRIRLSS